MNKLKKLINKYETLLSCILLPILLYGFYKLSWLLDALGIWQN